MQQVGLESLSPQDRARVIYTQARSEMTDRLWQAAIGSAQDDKSGAQGPCRHGPMGLPMGMMDLFGTGQDASALAMAFEAMQGAGAKPGIGIDSIRPPVAKPEISIEPIVPAVTKPGLGFDAPSPSSPVIKESSGSGPLGSLGANSGYAATLQRAAERSGLPATTLAAIVDAEAAKRPDGSWNLMSRNPRSSAAGLGQFLSGTWIGMAQKPGTWLYDVARQKGWLTESGRVAPAARGSLLALRYDATASINSIADYATSNIATIRRSGVRTGDDPQALARIAYLGHHLGPGDAIRYLKGGLAEGRATVLLKAQIGSASARERIARTGDAAQAHRDWLNGYIARKIRPDRFAALPQAASS
ncbi:peptidoglycan-binding protein [Citromicrobium bathyomarinum]|uniref:peptidoglycan-binding protein n=1 Tax=Alteriqipengyuania lutimaris TaxID=1538146 RepID=UPI001CFC592B|nr:peptidoglycan-binding protein [Alteriqipengyuania lutimaris]